MIYVVLVLVVVVALIAVFALVLAKQNPELFRALLASLMAGKAASYPYKRKEYLLSEAEKSFFLVLRKAAGGRYELLSKVRLSDLLYLPKGTENAQGLRNRIQQKHVDFVLCDPVKISPLLAIELDDKSHEQPDRKERDCFVDEALKAAGLPLLRVRASRAYSPAELMGEIQQRISG